MKCFARIVPAIALLFASGCATTPQGNDSFAGVDDAPSFGYLHFLGTAEGQSDFILNITSGEGVLDGSYSWIDNTLVNAVSGTIGPDGAFVIEEFMEEMVAFRFEGTLNPAYTELQGTLSDETIASKTPFSARLIAEEVRDDRTLEHIGPEPVQMDIAFPEFETAGKPALARLSQILAETVLRAADDFETEMLGMAAESAASADPFPVRGFFSFCDYQIVSLFPGFACVRFDAYSFTGGAHGMPLCETFNAALEPDGDVRILTLDDVLASAEAFDRIAARTLETLREMEAGFVVDGTVTGLDRGQLSAFTLSPAGLVFIIAPYQAGPYAEGQYEVEFPLDQIGDILNPDILARLR
jgi:hypothetical protein